MFCADLWIASNGLNGLHEGGCATISVDLPVPEPEPEPVPEPEPQEPVEPQPQPEPVPVPVEEVIEEVESGANGNVFMGNASLGIAATLVLFSLTH